MTNKPDRPSGKSIYPTDRPRKDRRDSRRGGDRPGGDRRGGGRRGGDRPSGDRSGGFDKGARGGARQRDGFRSERIEAEDDPSRTTPPKKPGLPEVNTDNIVEVQGDRLQKVLANAGFGSRREIEEIMLAEGVRVDGEVATLGRRVLGGETIEINGKSYTVPNDGAATQTEVLVYHKPVGQISSREDSEGRPTVFSAIPKPKNGRWVMIGRLDINTSGLLLFTNNGQLANTMMHPSNEVVRSYRVRVFGNLHADAIDKLLSGVELEDGPAKFDRCEFIAGRGNNRWYEVSLCEGRNREVRRMFEAVGGTVSRLIRLSYGPITLPDNLKHGYSRWALEKELRELVKISEFSLESAVVGDGSVHNVEPRDTRFDDRRSSGGRDRRDARGARHGDRRGSDRRGSDRRGNDRRDDRRGEDRRGGGRDSKSGLERRSSDNRSRSPRDDDRRDRRGVYGQRGERSDARRSKEHHQHGSRDGDRRGVYGGRSEGSDTRRGEDRSQRGSRSDERRGGARTGSRGAYRGAKDDSSGPRGGRSSANRGNSVYGKASNRRSNNPDRDD